MKELIVYPDGRLIFGAQEFTCALGKAGVTSTKKEGDMATPAGRYPLRRVLFRPDIHQGLETDLPVDPIDADDGWCDDPGHPAYNRPIKLPFEASHEKLWRDDRIYDVIVILGHNDSPPIPGQGSAIFFHLARPDYSGTEGCIAVNHQDMLEILRDCDENTWMEIKVNPEQVN